MKGYKQDQYGIFHPVEVSDYPATHAAGAPARPPVRAGRPTAPAKPSSPQRSPNKPNRPTGKPTVVGLGHRKTKPGFKSVKGNVSHPAPTKRPPTPLHKATTQAKHMGAAAVGLAPQKRAKGPSLGGGPCPTTYVNPQGQTVPTGYVDASGNPLDSAPWAPGSPYENAVFVDLDGSQWLGQISIYDGSFTTLEQLYRPGQPASTFNNPVAGLTNGHAYLFPPVQPGVRVPSGGYYSDLIKVQTDLGVFSGGIPAGAQASSAIAQVTGVLPTGDGGALALPGDGGDGGALGALGAVMIQPSSAVPYTSDGGLPVAQATPTLSGIATSAPVYTPSGVAAPAGGIDLSTLQALFQGAQAQGAAQVLGGQADGGQGDGGQADGGQADGGQADGGQGDGG